LPRTTCKLTNRVVAQTYATSFGGPGSVPKQTSSSGGNNGNNGTTGPTANSSGAGSTAVIVGGIVAVVGVLVLLGFIALFFYRRARRHRNNPPPMTAFNELPSTSHDTHGGKSELDSTAITSTSLYPPPPGSPHPSLGAQTGRTDTVSPVSAYTKTSSSPFATPAQPAAAELHDKPYQARPSEMQGQYGHPPPGYPPLPPELQAQTPRPMPPELHSQTPRPMPSELHSQTPQPAYPELQGGQYPPMGRPPQAMTGQYRPPQEAYGQQIHEFPGQNQIYEAHGQNVGPQRAELQGVGWQSGPVAGYHEMDGGYGQYQPPHAR
jgi:hypothetical protein